MSKIVAYTCVLILSTFAISTSQGVAFADETVKYEVLEKSNDFEIRLYQPVVVAEVLVESTLTDAGNEAFGLLFGYISGENQDGRKIPMTSPVDSEDYDFDQDLSGDLQPAPSRGQYVVRFYMPSEYTQETTPKPSNSQVQIRLLPERVIAAHEYSGTWSERRYRHHEKILAEELRNRLIEVIGPATFARYDSPMTPWFLRRNEVMVEISAAF